MTSSAVARVVLFAGLISSCPGPAVAQSIRASGVTTFQYVGFRPLAEDSVRVEETRGDGLLRRSESGFVVRCVTGDPFCRFRRPAGETAIAPLSQDLRVSAWGIGRGVRAYGHVRGRGAFGGGSDIWPRSEDNFDLLAAYLELDRRWFRIRAGRQWSPSGLGFYNFDGASITVRPVDGLALEAYGGRSLLRGVDEPRAGGALEAVEPFATDEGGLLIGGRATWRPVPTIAVGAEYQRDVREDRHGLFSERAAGDALWRIGRVEVSGAMEADLATRTLNDLRFDVRGRVGSEFGAAGFVRRYQPFFEAWTIWGAFTPVSFDEVGARGWWRSPGAPLTVEGGAAWRSYDDTGTSATFGAVRSTGWRLNGSVLARPADRWELQARAGADVGLGAAGADGSVRLERALGPAAHVGATVLAFQRIYEFRVTEGTVWGLGLDGRMALGDRARAAGGATWYVHRVDDAGPDADWNQVRASLSLEWVVGAEPVASGTSRR